MERLEQIFENEVLKKSKRMERLEQIFENEVLKKSKRR